MNASRPHAAAVPLTGGADAAGRGFCFLVQQFEHSNEAFMIQRHVSMNLRAKK
jgi:hypothetical protein